MSLRRIIYIQLFCLTFLALLPSHLLTRNEFIDILMMFAFMTFFILGAIAIWKLDQRTMSAFKITGVLLMEIILFLVFMFIFGLV